MEVVVLVAYEACAGVRLRARRAGKAARGDSCQVESGGGILVGLRSLER